MEATIQQILSEKPPSFFTLFPLFTMIILAFLTKNTIISALSSIIVSNTLIFEFNFIKGIFYTFSSDIPKSIADQDNVKIILFTLLTNGFINLLIGSNLFDNFGLYIKTKITKESDTYKYITLICFIMFFDDYSAILVAGKLAPLLFGNNKINIKKVSYIIHTLSGTKAIFVPGSTYTAVTIPAVAKLTSEKEAFTNFIKSMPYQYYSIFTMAFLVINVLLDVDFWGMPVSPTQQTSLANPQKEKKEQTNKINENSEKEINMFQAFLPIIIVGIFIISVVSAFVISGYINSKAKNLSPVSFKNILENFSSDDSIIAASQCCLLLSIILLIFMRKNYFNTASELVTEGFNDVLSCLFMIILFAAFRESVKVLGTPEYIKSFMDKDNSVLGKFLDKNGFLLAPLSFLFSMVVSLLIASSWGALGITPAILSGFIKEGSNVNGIVGAMISGSVVGDHLSFYSDTANLTIGLTGVDKMEHYHGQKWYGLFNVGLSLGVGYLLGEFITPYGAVGLGVGIILGVHYYYYCKKKVHK